MGLMRKLMMGCIPGMRTLVNTTEPHYSPELMNTPITLTVGASYSISWTGAKPTTSSHYIYPFCIYVYGGASGFFDMCDVRIKKSIQVELVLSQKCSAPTLLIHNSVLELVLILLTWKSGLQ